VSIESLAGRTYLALVHYPVYDKNHKIVATSITNLDIHDIARSSKTYGLAAYFLIHPVAAQRELAQRILNHWQGDRGQEQNDFRSDALSIVRVIETIEDAVEQITSEQKARPLIVGTSAADNANACAVTPRDLVTDPVLRDRPLLLVFGTGWGLTAEWSAGADKFLRPLRGISAYNHLSVRSAAGIMLDRLFARPDSNSGEHSL
jgi:hypothetical protein